MQARISGARAAAATAVAMITLPGTAFANTHIDVGAAMFARAAQARYYAVFEQGTAINVHVQTNTPEESGMEAMMRVAHTLASQSVDIDADISQLIDEEFWNLV
ncbi:nitrate reductase assembly molybdenum cofactor insertion protein NarJ [Burkholderia sp. PvR073]|uniref:hypothetical protein n=1 Tax=Burkholderia ambifaria TaxID=152480 RepID=UPI003397C53A